MLQPGAPLDHPPPDKSAREGYGAQVYTVPAGHRAIVRHIDAAINNADMSSLANFQCYVLTNQAQYFYICYRYYEESRNSIAWNGHCVLNANERVYVYTEFGLATGEIFFYHLSGALMPVPS